MNWLKKLLGCKEDFYKEQSEMYKSRHDELEKAIKNLFGSIEQPKVVGKIDIHFVRNLVMEHMVDMKKLNLSDREYALTTLAEVRKFLRKDKTNLKKYMAEEHDCDNFSAELWGTFSGWQISLPFGIAWSKVHAFNIFIDDKYKVWIIEPQSDKIFSVDDIKKNRIYYPFTMVTI